eukprot:4882332-Alexandrium_andersonii.AAC.1
MSAGAVIGGGSRALQGRSLPGSWRPQGIGVGGLPSGTIARARSRAPLPRPPAPTAGGRVLAA